MHPSSDQSETLDNHHIVWGPKEWVGGVLITIDIVFTPVNGDLLFPHVTSHGSKVFYLTWLPQPSCVQANRLLFAIPAFKMHLYHIPRICFIHLCKILFISQRGNYPTMRIRSSYALPAAGGGRVLPPLVEAFSFWNHWYVGRLGTTLAKVDWDPIRGALC